MIVASCVVMSFCSFASLVGGTCGPSPEVKRCIVVFSEFLDDVRFLENQNNIFEGNSIKAFLRQSSGFSIFWTCPAILDIWSQLLLTISKSKSMALSIHAVRIKNSFSLFGSILINDNIWHQIRKRKYGSFIVEKWRKWSNLIPNYYLKTFLQLHKFSSTVITTLSQRFVAGSTGFSSVKWYRTTCFNVFYEKSAKRIRQHLIRSR